MRKMKTAIVGLGGRGMIHLDSFLKNGDRFDVVGLCDRDAKRLEEARSRFGFDAACCFFDADEMLGRLRPDCFCFVTMPQIRMEMIALGINHKVKGIVMEKPMAISVAEAREITRLLNENGIRCAVSHQMKHMDAFIRLKQVVDSGVLGPIERVHVETRPWFMQLGTHFTDYALWAIGQHPIWCVGHVHGREMLNNSHPAADFLCGMAQLSGGARLYIESGYLSNRHLEEEKFWFDNRLSLYGENGTVWAETDGAFGLQADGKPALREQMRTWEDQEAKGLQSLFAKAFADWMDGTAPENASDINRALRGFEMLNGMCVSALTHRRVDLPLSEEDARLDVFLKMKEVLPEAHTYGGRYE